jgi:hypothetical protein
MKRFFYGFAKIPLGKNVGLVLIQAVADCSDLVTQQRVPLACPFEVRGIPDASSATHTRHRFGTAVVISVL